MRSEANVTLTANSTVLNKYCKRWIDPLNFINFHSSWSKHKKDTDNGPPAAPIVKQYLSLEK